MPASVASLTGPITDAASWPTSTTCRRAADALADRAAPFDPLQQRVAAVPARSRMGHRPASPAERPLAELVQKRGDLLQVFGHVIERAKRRDHEVVRCLVLRERLSPAFVRADQLAINGRELAVVLEIGVRETRDERVRRIVRDEVPRELGREMLRGRGAARERREHLLAFRDPALLVCLAEHDLVAGLVHRGRK